MRHYYNEVDKACACRLRNLIGAGLLPYGDVDERSIEDVVPQDLVGYTSHHFFAGIGGWPLALRLAGWPEDRPIATGSCPCQPFSSTGTRKGFDDERHLWPDFRWLIEQSGFDLVLGEQVASKDAEPWLDAVLADLETMDFAATAVAFPAAGVGAPHIRDRTYWVGHRDYTGLEGHAGDGGAERREGESGPTSSSGVLDGLGGSDPLNGFWREADWLLCRDSKWRPVEPATSPLAARVPGDVELLKQYGNAIVIPQAVEFIRSVMDALEIR